jgi:hypothetical protein
MAAPAFTLRPVVAGGLAALALAPAAVAADPADFAARLEAALAAGPAAQDRLWVEGARDPSRRLLDVRTGALFEWSDVRVVPSAPRALAASPQGARRAALDVLVAGTAAWRPAAWGVARSFWTLQCDERNETNRVLRREEWALEERDGAWLAVERRPLGLLEIVEARLAVDVYPSQDAMLVEGTYYVRSRAGGVASARFLLDRRSAAYDFRVGGALVPVVRGNELGSLGLEGFSPELESSFAFPAPLAAGEEALVSFRLRSPLVHMTGEGFVTSLPRTSGSFRERLWLPVLAPPRADGPEASRIDLALRWPDGAFDRAGIAGPAVCDAVVTPGEEEASVHLAWTGDVRDVDFLLAAGDAAAAGDVLDVHGVPGRRGEVSRLVRADAEPASALAAGRRERGAVVAPLLGGSYPTAQDFGAELQELLPLDEDLLDELFDDSSTDAERGADDRSAN